MDNRGMQTLTGALLDPLLRDNPAGPRVTYYDDATGERIELSTVTLANWAAKTANLLRDELCAGPGSRVAVLLPPHWQTAAVVLGVWWVGAEVVLSGPADIALCTADRLDEAGDAVGVGEIAVLSLDAFGKGVDDLPVGITDFATAVRAQGDQIVPESRPGPALAGRCADDVLADARGAAAATGLSAADRVLSTSSWSTPGDLVANLVAVLAAGASLVQVANPADGVQDRRIQTEKVTKTLPLGMPRAALDVDELRTAALGSTSLWRRVDVVGETGSTNADLLARAAAGENIAGSVLLAEFQTAGRGRHGRSWSAPPRSQVSMSVGVDASGVAPAAWGWLPLLAGVAAAETLRERYGVDAGLKWPNDVLVGTGKLAGILAEVSQPGPVVVVGIGLNVSFSADEIPDPRATSLSMLGAPDDDRTGLAAALLTALSTRVQRWKSAKGADAELISDYQRFSTTIGTRVRALLPGDSEVTGIALGVDDAGRLRIDDGTRTLTISAGDITHLRPESA